MADKHTNRELFETLLIFATAAEADAWVIEGLEHELELLDRKRGAKGVDAKKAAEQAAVIARIEDVLAGATEPMRVKEIVAALDDDTTGQRVTAMVKKMVDAETVLRIEDKKIARFTLA